jgi:predicted NAD/FAD-binding protein
MYKKIVLLLLVSVACSKHIAIIGCGAGGAASAYFLNGFNVTIFEKASYCGGRTDFIQVEK